MLVLVGIIATVNGRWRWLSIVHPLLTSLVVTVTANHFWLDGLVAAALLALPLVAVRALSGRRHLSEGSRHPPGVLMTLVVTGGTRADRPDGQSFTTY